MCLTVVISIAIVFYSLVQFLKLIKFQDTTIMVSDRDSYFNTDS